MEGGLPGLGSSLLGSLNSLQWTRNSPLLPYNPLQGLPLGLVVTKQVTHLRVTAGSQLPTHNEPRCAFPPTSSETKAYLLPFSTGAGIESFMYPRVLHLCVGTPGHARRDRAEEVGQAPLPPSLTHFSPLVLGSQHLQSSVFYKPVTLPHLWALPG